MAEFKNMTVQALRDLARKAIGRGHSKLKTKAELIGALQAAEKKVVDAAEKAAEKVKGATEKAVAKVKDATGEAVRATEKVVDAARAKGRSRPGGGKPEPGAGEARP